MALLHLASRGLLARSTRVEPDSSQTSRLLDTQACEIIEQQQHRQERSRELLQ